MPAERMRSTDSRIALYLHCVGLRFLHDADGVADCHLRIALIGAEGHVDHYQRVLGGAGHALGVVDHLVDGDGDGGLVSGHHVGGRVSDQDHVYPCLVYDTGRGVVVCCEHGDFLAFLLHFQ